MKHFTVLSAVVLVGCSSVKVAYDTTGETREQPTKMEYVRIHKPTVDKSSVDFTKFASLNLPQDQGSMTEYHAPNGLNLVMDVKPFIGDLDDLVYMITAQTGYTYLPFSGLKVSPVMVTYHANNKTAFEMLVEINNKVGSNATIKISEVAKTVQVIYPISTQTFN